MQPAWDTDVWSNTHNQFLYSRLICFTYPKIHSSLLKLLLKEVLLVLILTHLKPKGKQISGRLQSPDLAGLIYYFSSNAIYFPKKSVEKIGTAQNFQAEEHQELFCRIWTSFPQSTQSLLTQWLAARIVVSKEIWSMETAGANLQFTKGGHKDPRRRRERPASLAASLAAARRLLLGRFQVWHFGGCNH